MRPDIGWVVAYKDGVVDVEEFFASLRLLHWYHKQFGVGAHCRNGANRSTLYAAGYTMAFCRVSAEDAYEHIWKLRRLADLAPCSYGGVERDPLQFLDNIKDRLWNLFAQEDPEFRPTRLPDVVNAHEMQCRVAAYAVQNVPPPRMRRITSLSPLPEHMPQPPPLPVRHHAPHTPPLTTPPPLPPGSSADARAEGQASGHVAETRRGQASGHDAPAADWQTTLELRLERALQEAAEAEQYTNRNTTSFVLSSL